MKKLSSFAAVTLLSLVSFSVLKARPIPASSDSFIRIINGDEVERGAYPFMVSLQADFYDGHFCGGSLVHENFVLTAGHCTQGMDAEDFVVVLGLHGRDDLEGADVFEIEEIIEHPDYDGNVDYDFSLLRLKDDVDTSLYQVLDYNHEELLIPSFDDEQRMMSTTMGWGTTERGGLAEVLMEVEVPLVAHETCEQAYPFGLTESMICAGYDEGGKDSCQGDSGGPLVIFEDGLPLLAGTVSWGYGCAMAGKYGVYGKVSVAADWMDEVLSVDGLAP